MFKAAIRSRLETRVKQYFAKHTNVKLIVVTGSAGKVSTKRAVADVLSQKYRVRMHDGAAYDPLISMLLGLLGIQYPKSSRSIAAWWTVLRAARQRVKSSADTDVVIQELYVKKPGDIALFAKFLKPHIAIITAVSPEQMDQFNSIDEVAKEELSITKHAETTLLNRDDIEARFAEYVLTPSFATYGTTGLAEYRFETSDFLPSRGYSGSIITPQSPDGFAAQLHVIGEHSIRSVMAAIAVATQVGMTNEEIAAGVQLIRPAPGRMNLLRGIGDADIIDDTYNSSPASSLAALQTLYSFDQASIRIAVMADMTNLGPASQAEHEKIGQLCDPNKLEWLVLVGPESEKYLAPVARSRGCQVKTCADAIEAATFVRSVTEPGAAILVKGPRDAFYMEEAVKTLCNMTDDAMLVRQDPAWMMRKAAYFDHSEERS